jgi:hypothetical protein
MLLGTPLALWAGVLSTLATAGVGLVLIPVLFWGGVGYHAFHEVDRRTHIKGLL